VTHLRKRMLEELQRRNYSEGTTRAYLQAVQQFAVHFGRSPDKLGPNDLRSYQAYLLVERKLAVASVVARVAALRFFFVRTLNLCVRIYASNLCVRRDWYFGKTRVAFT
jgi:integrase/recombinase XerD